MLPRNLPIPFLSPDPNPDPTPTLTLTLTLALTLALTLTLTQVVETGLAKEPIPGATEAKAAEQSLRARRRGPDGGVRGPDAGTTR